MEKFNFKKNIDINNFYSSYLIISDDTFSSSTHFFLKEDNNNVSRNNLLKIIESLPTLNMYSLNHIKYDTKNNYFYIDTVNGYSLQDIYNTKNYKYSIEILLRTLIIFCNMFIKLGLINSKIPYISSNQIIISDTGKLIFQVGINYAINVSLLEKDLMYVSPEFISKGVYDERSIVYSIGVILYKLSVKKNPFHYKDNDNLIYKIIDESPTLPSLHDFNLESELEQIILKCLKKDPSERFQSVLELVKEIKSFYDANYRANLLPINIGINLDSIDSQKEINHFNQDVLDESIDSNLIFNSNNYYWLMNITNDWFSFNYQNLEDFLDNTLNSNNSNGIGILDQKYIAFIYNGKLLSIYDISNGELIKDIRFIKALSNLEFRIPNANEQILPLTLSNMLLKTNLSQIMNTKGSSQLNIKDDFSGYVTTFIDNINLGVKRSVLNLIEDPLLNIYLSSSYSSEYNIFKPKNYNFISSLLSNSLFEVVLLDSLSLQTIGKEIILNNENIKFIVLGEYIEDNFKLDNTIFVKTSNLFEILEFFKKIFPLDNKKIISNVFSLIHIQAGKIIKLICFNKDFKFYSYIDKLDSSIFKNLNLLEVCDISNTFFDYEKYSKTKEAIVSLVKDSFKNDNSNKNIAFSEVEEEIYDDKNIYLSYVDYNDYTLDKLINSNIIYTEDLKSRYINNIVIPERNDNNSYIFINWLIKEFLFLVLDKKQTEYFNLIISKLPQISKIVMDEQITDSSGNSIDVPLVIYFENNEMAIMAYGGGDIDEINAIESICNSLVNTSGVNLIAFFYLSNTKYSESSISRYKNITRQNNYGFLGKKLSSKGLVNINNHLFHFILLNLDEDDKIHLFLPEI